MQLHHFVYILFAPFIIVLCLVVFIYERLIFNQDDRVEKDDTLEALLSVFQQILPLTAWWFLYGRSVFGFILEISTFWDEEIAFPNAFLGILPLVTYPQAYYWVAIAIPVYILWCYSYASICERVFDELVPSLVLRWNSSVYKDLPSGSNPTRVLEILPSSGSDPIECNLNAVDLSTTKYEALSYSWGGHLMLRRIITVNSRSFLVTDSIYRALRALRHGDKKRIVWIDAVCINQGDHKEKIKQVQNLMQPIYEKAQRVIVWLGAAPADLSVAFDRVQQQIKGSTERNKERLGDREVWAPALQDILNRRWWSRVWVVQEVALGRRVILRCGDEEIGWESLSKFLASQTNTQSLDIKREVSSLIKFTTARRGGFPLRKRVGLLHLAAHFRDRTATDPRDKLFGLLGLVNKEKEPLEPDWTKAPLTVFADFAASCIERNKNLGILVLAEEQCASQCSWAVSWDAAVQKPNRISLWPPELYNNPITRVRKYSATQDLPAECKRNGDDWGSIFLAGWQEDAVAIVGDHTAFNILGNERQSIRHIVSTWEKLAGAHSKGSTREKQAAFNRTIVADACDGDHPEDWVEWVDKNMQTNSYQAHERAMASSIKEPDHQSPRKHNCVTVQQACTQRRFFITSNGRYGIGPTDTHVRDKVCMLLGAAVPFILRETDHRHKWTSRWCNRKVHPEGKEFHKVVGQAYVDGVMDYEGDSKADVGCGVVKLRDFLLE